MISLDTTYTFECTASFCNFSPSKINKLFKDGRVASKFLELQLEEWFPQLKFVDKKGYDHVDNNNFKYDAKCFTKSGARFSPSIMQGGGRSVDEEKLWEHASDMIYIFCDIIDFPKVRVIFKHGSSLTQYSNGTIPYNERDALFT